MFTILGAGGAIANEVSKILIAEKKPVRLVSRNPKSVDGAETKSADLTIANEVAEAVKGSDTVLLSAGLAYNIKIWRRAWPMIMQNTIDACKLHRSRLIFFDNIYCLGKVDGPMTEESPFKPDSKKGEVRAKIATQLLDEGKKGNIKAIIARAADFYGPNVKTSIFNTIVTDNFAKGKQAQWLVSDKFVHSYTYTPDCGRAICMLVKSEDSWNQIWHMPTAHPPLTGKEMIEIAAKHFNRPAKYWVIPKWIGKLGGIFDTEIREINEMTYQNDSPYIFDSSKFENAFAYQATSYEDGIRQTVLSYQK